MDNDAAAFLKALEEKQGGQLTWRTFCTYYADSTGVVRDHGVFLYEVNKHFYYQDFEHTAQIFGIPIPKPKNAKPYEMFEGDFDPADVTTVRLVRKKAAEAFCNGTKKYEKLKPAGPFARLFCQCVTEFALKDKKVLFFELMDKTLNNKITEAQTSNKE